MISLDFSLINLSSCLTNLHQVGAPTTSSDEKPCSFICENINVFVKKTLLLNLAFLVLFYVLWFLH